LFVGKEEQVKQRKERPAPPERGGSAFNTMIYVPSHTQNTRLRMKFYNYVGIDPKQKEHMHILKRNRLLHESFFQEKIAHHVEAINKEIIQSLATSSGTQKISIAEEEAPPPGRRIRFFDQVEVIPIEHYTEYTPEEKQGYWQGSLELRDTAEKNIIEFEYEGFKWENVVEEDQMQEINGEYLHPVFC